MKNETEVLVIGGGIAGCSTLYHLTAEGITDCMLLERDELTSGTTWHSAAQVTNFGGNQTMLGLKSHSIALYRELAADAAYPINYHYGTGGLRLASTRTHLDGYHHFVSQARGMGVDFEVIDAAEAGRRHPLMATEGILGALWDPHDGDIDPAQLCQALVRRARMAGAEVHRHTPVTRLDQQRDCSWIVGTPKGDIRAGKIVNAGGYRCNEVGALLGVVHPVASMEHQYMLTEPIAAIAALDFRVPLIRCPTDDFYQRQEKNGLLIGFYEQGCKTWGLGGIDPGFANALCPDDLDRVTEVMEGAIRRLPCLAEAGIHTIINGPITYTPDGLPLVGPIPGKRNAYCITGLRAGLGEGGGHGWLLAQIIAHGEASYDTWCLDPRRFSRHVDVDFTAKKAIEDYRNEFRFHLPHEHRPAGRPLRVSPLFDRLRGLGAEFAVVDGWERAACFPPAGAVLAHSFRRTALDEVIATEVAAVSSAVGVMEVNGFNRFEITGPGAHAWLDGIMCSRVPRQQGRVGLCYFLNDLGGVKGEATIANLPGGRIWYGSAAASERHDRDWLEARLPKDGSLGIESLTESHDMLVLAGPRARALLSAVAPEGDWAEHRWLDVREVTIAGVGVVAMAVSFSGEMAWELHVANAGITAVFEAVWAAGPAFGLRPFGLWAAESMRLEKSYRGWKADIITEYGPSEHGLSRFVAKDKDFIGKAAMDARMAAGQRRAFVTLEIEDRDAAPHPGDSLVAGGRVVGTVTSAGFGHRIGKTLALGFVVPAFAAEGTRMEAVYLGRSKTARVIAESPYDPQNARLKG